MELIKYFVENFDITKHSVEANIYAESMNCNSLYFVVRPHEWRIRFRLACMYGEVNQLIRRRIVIEGADFLGEHKGELEKRLTKKLEEKEFISQLNSAIQIEKDRTKKIHDNTMRQREVEFIGQNDN